MKNKNRRWLVAWTLASIFPNILYYQAGAEQQFKDTSSKKEIRSLIAPRMDYEQWTPLGRGDPLKNDPTYDYVPPVLDKVQYWIDPASRKPDTTLPTETQKTEVLVLGVSSKKPSTGTSITTESKRYTNDPLFFKLVEGPKFGIQNNYQRMSRPHYPSYYSYSTKNKSEQRVPYTILMPPPIVLKKPTLQQVSTTEFTTNASSKSVPLFSTTLPPITIQNASLLFHSSTLGHLNEFRDKGSVGAFSSQVTWKTPPDTNSFIEEQKIVQHSSSSNFYNPIRGSDNQVMHKGQVADGDLGIANTYVNIGKPEAQMHSPNDMEISSVSVEPPQISVKSPPMIIHPTHSLEMSPMTLQTLQTIQTMKVPTSHFASGFTKPANSLHGLLRKEIADIPKSSIEPLPLSVFVTTTPSPTSTTTTTSLTTDPIFKHYRQPNEPLKGPMYLIIQGHSKVKTYGPGKQIHGISIRESNEIPTAEEQDEYLIKDLHEFKRESGESRLRQGRSSSFESLNHVIQTGLGAINLVEIGDEKNKDDLQETELVVRYDIEPRDEITTERYYKGIVEAGDMARNMKT